MANYAAGIFLLLTLLYRVQSAEIPTVTTELGTITGETRSVKFQKNEYQVDRYLGIPYAKPPVGELRFKRPEQYGALPEPYSATDVGPTCPQYDFLGLMPKEKTSEDCLFLNIYVPRQQSDYESGHAVMFFIHGGGFTIGSGTLYDGGVLSSVGNVIVVAINYRLGLLGFLDIDDIKSSGNFGLFDQQLALNWVKENIGAFGGDKDRVTIFGESAGSMSVSIQMLYPPNKGLFTGGIAQSGALTLPGIYHQNNIETAKYFAKNMSCNVENMDEVFSCLQSATPERLIKVVEDAMASGLMEAMTSVGTSPTIDGEFIKTNPIDLLKKSTTEESDEINFFRSVKLINGVNGKEGAMFLLMLGNPDTFDELEITRNQINTEQIPGALAVVFGARTVPDVVKQLLIAEYTDWTNPDDPKKLREQLVRLFGDIYFNVPAIEMSRVHSNASNVDSYLYNFVPVLDKHLMPTPNWVDMSNHGDDLGPVFGYNFNFKALINISDYTPPEWELEMSRRMMTYWTNFAKSGDPNKPASETTPVVWPKYDITSQSCIRFDREDSTRQFLFARETEFWRNTVSAVFDATEHADSISSQYGHKDKETCEKDGTCE